MTPKLHNSWLKKLYENWSILGPLYNLKQARFVSLSKFLSLMSLVPTLNFTSCLQSCFCEFFSFFCFWFGSKWISALTPACHLLVHLWGMLLIHNLKPSKNLQWIGWWSWIKSFRRCFKSFQDSRLHQTTWYNFHHQRVHPLPQKVPEMCWKLIGDFIEQQCYWLNCLDHRRLLQIASTLMTSVVALTFIHYTTCNIPKD
jgi:hypothetical protein